MEFASEDEEQGRNWLRIEHLTLLLYSLHLRPKIFQLFVLCQSYHTSGLSQTILHLEAMRLGCQSVRIPASRLPVFVPEPRVLQKKSIFFIVLRFSHLHLPLTNARIDEMVERKCENCRYFEQNSDGLTRAECVWGDCMKSKEHSGDAQDTETRRFFTWADHSCDDFELKETQSGQ